MNRGPPTTEYRELRRADLPSFEKVMLQGLGKLERATGLDELSITQFQSLRRRGVWTLLAFLRATGRAPIRFFVGVDRGQVLGTASVILLAKVGYVVGVATDSSSRSLGIATHLLERIHLEAKRKGKPWLALDVETDNETAIRVYKRLGFEERAQFGWYAGPTPGTDVSPSSAMTEASRSDTEEVVDWINRSLPPAVRDPLPATRRRLSHFEIVTRVPRAPSKTWRLSSSDQITAVVRCSYIQTIKTGYVLPITYDPSLTEESLLSIAKPAIGWIRSLGATRTVVVVSDPQGAWGSALASIGLPRAVSTTLMARQVAK